MRAFQRLATVTSLVALDSSAAWQNGHARGESAGGATARERLWVHASFP